MTPWQLKILIKSYEDIVERDHNDAAFFMYWNAVLSRWGKKKFPKLNEFKFGNKKQVKGIDEDAIINQMRSHKVKVEEK